MLRPASRLAAIALVLAGIAAAASPVHHRLGGMAWLALITVWAGLALAAARIGPRVRPCTALVIVLLGAAAMRLPLLLGPPYLSSDIFRYVWDGRVQAAGINPYKHVPAADALAFLRDKAIYPHINRAKYAPTIYPAGAQMIFLAITRLGESVLVMKLGLLAFEALAIGCLIGILRALDKPVANIAAYAWHPLPVWEIAGNGHVDAAMLGVMLAGLLLYLRGKALPAALVASLAAFVKPTALLAMPVLWRPWDWRLPVTLACVGALLYLPYLSAGWGVLGFLPQYLVEEELSSGGGLRYLGLLQRLTGPIPSGALIYLLASGAFLAALALRTGFRPDRSAGGSVHCLGVLLIAFMVLLTPHYPWYYLALVPLLALGGWVTPWVLTTGGFLLYDVIPGDRMPPFAVREAVLHLTALAAFAYDYRHSRSITAMVPAGDLPR